MNNLLDSLFLRKCTGIYVGLDAVIAVNSIKKRDGWEVDSIVSQTQTVRENDYIPTTQNYDDLLEMLDKVVTKNIFSESVQVAFDDRFVRFFVIPLSEKPGGREEVDAIVRWHAKKVLQSAEEYVFTTQLVEAVNGFRLYGAAVKSDLMSNLGTLLQSKKCAWYVADSAAGYIWNAFDHQQKSGAFGFVAIGRYGWTLIVSDENGNVELIKPGKWSYYRDQEPGIKSGMIEMHRLLATFVDKHVTAKPLHIYIDTGDYPEALEIAKEIFDEVIIGIERQGHEAEALLSMVPEQYSHELSVAIKASFPR